MNFKIIANGHNFGTYQGVDAAAALDAYARDAGYAGYEEAAEVSGDDAKAVEVATEIEVDAREVADHDDCLEAAAQLVAARERVERWQVQARWTDDDRDSITVTIL
jgi:hypothetical protein